MLADTRPLKREGALINQDFTLNSITKWLFTLLQSENSLYNQEDEAVINFPPWDGGIGMNEPGYARVGSPSGQSKGYACLKPTPERCRSEYQKLLQKPAEGKTITKST